jgi:hypothetical protein
MKAPAGNHRHLLRGTANLGAAILAIALVSGVQACGGDPMPRADPTTPSPVVDGETIEVPADLRPPPEVTPAPPTQIEIRGRQVPLAPGVSYGPRGAPQCDPSPCPPRLSFQIVYAEGPVALGYSIVVFDADHNLTETEIKPEHLEKFQPILDVLLSSIIIRGEAIPLMAGMTYGRGIEVCVAQSCRFRGFWHVDYDSNSAEEGNSRLIFDGDYNLVENSVRAEDQDEFQPILDALAGASPVPSGTGLHSCVSAPLVLREPQDERDGNPCEVGRPRGGLKALRYIPASCSAHSFDTSG